MKVSHRIPIVFLVFMMFTSAAFAQKLEPGEIIARHLNSISTQANREALNTLFAAGFSEFEAKVPTIKGAGKAVVISNPDNLYFLMSLNSRDYPFEKIGAFGDKLSLPFITPGNRSLLGAFLNENSRILSDSLFCGSMSLRWIKRIAGAKDFTLRSAGTRKINGRQTHVLDVLTSGSGSDDFKERLFFDAENFRHIRSEYHREVRTGRVVFGQQNQQANATADLIEEFSDFREANGFTFPYVYKVTFSTNSPTQLYENSWGIKVSAYYLNQKLTPDFFTFDVQ